MALTVQPIRAAERVHCAYCHKPLQPNQRCRKTFYSGTQEAQGRTVEEQLAAYQTNRRIVRIARTYSHETDDNGERTGKREAWRIEVTHWPEELDDWGFWGRFCGQLCAARFGYASHKAGYRIRR